MKKFEQIIKRSKAFYVLLRCLRFVVWLFFKTLYRIEVTGAEKIPKKGRLILCSNHISYADPVIIEAYFPGIIFFMAKVEIFRNSFFTSFLKYFNAFPVNRNSFDRQALRHSALILENDQVVGIFPEGTRSPEGVIKEGQKGLGLISVMAGSDILPMAISGTNRIVQKPHRRFFFPRVRLAFGDIIKVDPIIKKYGSKNSIDVIVAQTMKSISSLYDKINI